MSSFRHLAIVSSMHLLLGVGNGLESGTVILSNLETNLLGPDLLESFAGNEIQFCFSNGSKSLFFCVNRNVPSACLVFAVMGAEESTLETSVTFSPSLMHGTGCGTI